MNSRATEAVLGLQCGGDGAGQKDLVHLEEEAQSDRDDDLAVDAPDRKSIKAPPDVVQPDLAVGLHQCGGHFESPLSFEPVEWLSLL
jgi:hypothetical protein